MRRPKTNANPSPPATIASTNCCATRRLQRRSHVEQVLEGLGFESEDSTGPLTTFSGGQQSRLHARQAAARLPRRHAPRRAEQPSRHRRHALAGGYLVKQPEAMLIVSHDRYFLDRVVTKVFELHGKRITSYPGNYKQYLRLRQERYEHELKAWESQREYIEKQEEYIRRVHYGQLHKQAQSRQKCSTSSSASNGRP